MFWWRTVPSMFPSLTFSIISLERQQLNSAIRIADDQYHCDSFSSTVGRLLIACCLDDSITSMPSGIFYWSHGKSHTKSPCIRELQKCLNYFCRNCVFSIESQFSTYISTKLWASEPPPTEYNVLSITHYSYAYSILENGIGEHDSHHSINRL